MSLIAVWVDQKHANVFKFTSAGVQKEEFNEKFLSSHIQANDHLAKLKQEEQVFKKLLPQLNDAEEILILGPGVTKTHFKKYLENHSGNFGSKIVGCETTDHPTEPQLLSLASKFFSSEHLKHNLS